MIKAYLVGISTHYENEDIEIRYRIFKDQQLVCEKSVLHVYRKPLIVTHVALLMLLKELDQYDQQEITIMINDAALYEQIRGTSKTKNKDVQKMASIVKEELNKRRGSIVIKDVGGDPKELAKWNELLQP